MTCEQLKDVKPDKFKRGEKFKNVNRNNKIISTPWSSIYIFCNTLLAFVDTKEYDEGKKL